MKKSVSVLFIFFTFFFCVNAQKSSIVDDLNTSKAGQGKVTVYHDEAIKNLLGSSIYTPGKIDKNALMNQLNTTSDESNSDSNMGHAPKNFIKAKGFRIQAYSGSNQKRSKNEAQNRKNTIQSSFPNMEVTVTYNSPVWRVKAGNFKTKEQADQALSEMRAKFAGFGREMYIVSDIIKIPVE